MTSRIRPRSPFTRVPTRACLFAVALALPGGATAQMPMPAGGTSGGLSQTHLDQITRLVEEFVESRRVAGAVVGVARNGRVEYLESVGLSDLDSRTPMVDNSVFRIYSMTKAVTAVTAMTLLEEGRFALDDPVSDYLPSFTQVVVQAEDGSTRPPARAITIRDLFFHTAGLSHRSSREYAEAGVRSREIRLPEFIDNIVRVPLRDDPGARFRYSASPTVLGRLIEIWSGQDFDEVVQHRVLTPLQMDDTGFQVRADQRSRLTSVYRTEDGRPLEPYQIERLPFTERPALLEGAVGLVSTVPDFMRFAQMLLDGGTLDGTRIVSVESARFLTSNGMPETLLPVYGAGHGWGAASVSVVIDAAAAGGGVFEGEYRWDGSAGTEFWVDPTSETVLVTAWQSNPANPGQLRQQIRHLVREAIRAGA